MTRRAAPLERLRDLLGSQRGLTVAEVNGRRERYGANAIVEAPPARWRELARDTAKDPMLWFLGATSLLYAVVGELGEALIPLVALMPLIGMDAFLHWRTQASAEGLRTRLAVRAVVVRDGSRIVRHLRLNGFDPIVFDGRDPAAFVWAILEIERRLERLAEEVKHGKRRYPVPLPYGIAVAPKGYGFPGAGTNLAHNLPLMANPRTDREAAGRFNRGAWRLWVPGRETRAGSGAVAAASRLRPASRA